MWGYAGARFLNRFGTGTRTTFYRNILDPPPEPIVFRPTDLSDCVLWLDANDSSTIDYHTEGGNTNRIKKWFDKAKPSEQNYYAHPGNDSNSGLYNVHYMNQLRTVYFEPNTYLDSHQTITYPFQARTFFAVNKVLTDMSGGSPIYLAIYSGNTANTGEMQTAITWDGSNAEWSYAMCARGVECGIVFNTATNPFHQRQILMFANTDALDLSGNAGSIDLVPQTLVGNDAADAYSQIDCGYSLNNPSYGTAQDIAEIIMYARVLTVQEQTKVLEYLADKWNLSGPTNVEDSYRNEKVVPAQQEGKEPEPPLVFSYTYIVYTQFAPAAPNWYWCDENVQVEDPPVLAEGYDGTTALRDGLAVVVSGVFYA